MRRETPGAESWNGKPLNGLIACPCDFSNVYKCGSSPIVAYLWLAEIWNTSLRNCSFLHLRGRTSLPTHNLQVCGREAFFIRTFFHMCSPSLGRETSEEAWKWGVLSASFYLVCFVSGDIFAVDMFSSGLIVWCVTVGSSCLDTLYSYQVSCYQSTGVDMVRVMSFLWCACLRFEEWFFCI